jgi:hypothetical protein
MKTNNILFIMIATAASLLISCEQGGIEPKESSTNATGVTPEGIRFRDSVVASIQSQTGFAQDNARSQRIVTISAIKLSCDRFRVTVNLNQADCPTSPSEQVVGYWTLFSTAGIKNLTPTPGTPCLNIGPQFSFDYTASRVSYLQIVLLPFFPVSRASGPILMSNTIILTPDC